MLLQTKNLPTTGAVVLETFSPLRYAIRNGNGQICNGLYDTAFDAMTMFSLLFADLVDATSNCEQHK